MDKKGSILNIGLKWGLILGLMMIIMGIIINMFHMYESNSFVQIISLILLVSSLWMAISEYKGFNDGFGNFGELFGLGMLVLGISVVLSSIFTYINMTIIDPEIVDAIKELQIIEMEKQGLSDDQIDQALSFMTPGFMVAIAFLIQAFVGTIVALLTAAIFKNNRPVEF